MLGGAEGAGAKSAGLIADSAFGSDCVHVESACDPASMTEPEPAAAAVPAWIRETSAMINVLNIGPSYW